MPCALAGSRSQVFAEDFDVVIHLLSLPLCWLWRAPHSLHTWIPFGRKYRSLGLSLFLWQ